VLQGVLLTLGQYDTQTIPLGIATRLLKVIHQTFLIGIFKDVDQWE